MITSSIIGVVCAASGILARPKVPSAENRSRTVIAATSAAVPVIGWVLWCGHPVAAAVGFLAATFVLGALRDKLRRADDGAA